MEKLKTIPMSTEDIQELFMNQDHHYNIDLLNSKLKGEAFITYIANMQISCSIQKDSQLDSETKLNVLEFFFSFRQTIKCDTLLLTCAHILLRSRKIDFDTSDSWLSIEEMDTFILNNKEQIKNSSDFLDSSLVFIPSFNNNYRESIFEPSIEAGSIEVVEDPNFLGVNILGLYTIPSFLEFFIAAGTNEPQKMTYYKNQVELLQYNKTTIFKLITAQEGDSFLMSLCHLVLSTEEKDRQLFDELISNKLPKTIADDSHI